VEAVIQRPFIRKSLFWGGVLTLTYQSYKAIDAYRKGTLCTAKDSDSSSFSAEKK